MVAATRLSPTLYRYIPLDYLVILAVGLTAGTISGVVGFGSSIMLMPVLVVVFGPLEAVPIMAVAGLMANFSRVLAWWREIDWRVTGAYAASGVPAAALGAATLVALPPHAVEAVLGVFFLAMIPARHWLAGRNFRLRLAHMAVVGALLGYLTGIVVSTGPINTPFFLAYGLVKGAYIGTEAAASLAVYAAKAAAFRGFGALPWPAVVKGLLVGTTLMAGSFLAKRLVLRLDPAQFRWLMDALMLAAGITMLWAAWQG
ncbi:MAG: sulfite exporter TauE/SafE family protein [Burkholderiales bacterium]|nr:sulfite exporter TauE/SafE family protein [Burkholderiales bacterium]